MNLHNVLRLPYYFIKNREYNRLTSRVLKVILKPDSNCIDIGSHKGKILQQFIELAPRGMHWAFEPLPAYYKKLQQKFAGSPVVICPEALSDCTGEAKFQFVKNSPGYSGFRRRTYHVPFPGIETITVKKTILDSVIPCSVIIDCIKLDVEGAELEVLKGAEQTLKRNKPFLIFEHGKGAAPFYDTTPYDIYDFLTDCGLQISTMKCWLANQPALSRELFARQFYREENYYFIGHA